MGYSTGVVQQSARAHPYPHGGSPIGEAGKMHQRLTYHNFNQVQ
jgi:hypothetical protein